MCMAEYIANIKFNSMHRRGLPTQFCKRATTGLQAEHSHESAHDLERVLDDERTRSEDASHGSPVSPGE